MATCLRVGCTDARSRGLFCEGHQPHQYQPDDEQIAQASIPSAAFLLKAAIGRGYIKPTSSYVAVPA